LALVITGKLIFALVALTTALITNPVILIAAGIVAAVAAIAAVAYLIVKNWGPIKDFFADLWLGIKQTFADAWDFIKGIVDDILGAVDKIKNALGDAFGPGKGNPLADVNGGFGGLARRALGVEAMPAPTGGKTVNETRVKVDFANAPKGTRVTADPRSSGDV